MTVAMYDPAKLYRANRAEFDAAIVRVLESGKIDWGAEVPAFEAEFGDWLGARHAIGVGSGGVCATEDAELADRIRKLSADGQERARHHASPRPLALHHETEGENSRLHEIQAAILRVKLPGSDNTLAMRRAQAARYSEALAGLPADLPHVVPGCIHAWRNYVIEVEDRAALAAHLAGQGIGSDALYSPPMHVQPVYASLGYGEGSLPATERSCSRVLSLPIGPHLTLDDIDTVAAAVRTGLV